MINILGAFTQFNSEEVIWLITMILGLAFAFYGVIYWLTKENKSDIHYVSAAFFEFVACWIMYIPEEIFNDSTGTNVMLRIIEGISTALLKSFNIYAGNGYEKVVFGLHPNFSSVYGIIRVLANIVLIIFVGGFIVKFLDGPWQRLRLSLNRRKYSYLLSECNDKTIALAKSISGKVDIKKNNIIFACSQSEVSGAGREKIASVGGIYLNSDIAVVLDKLGHAKGLEIFLFEENEENNLKKLEEISTFSKNNEDVVIKCYVELIDTPWGMYNEYAKKNKLPSKTIINFVRAEENFALNNLLKKSIFEAAIEDNGERKINVLIIGGMNIRNLEMIKAILSLAQMPGYILKLTVIDAGNGRDKLKQLMPEIYDFCDVEGDAFYRIQYHSDVDFETLEYEQCLENKDGLSFVFINAGADLLNVNLAKRLKAHRVQKGFADDNCIIQVNMAHKEISKSWNEDLVRKYELVGGIDETFNYEFITMSELEKASMAIHAIRQQNKDNPKSWEEYCNNEFNRHSVYARTLSLKYKVELIDIGIYPISDEAEFKYDILKDDYTWKMYEHMRWNMYMRTLGYQKSSDSFLDKKTREMATVHNSLVPFSELSKSEQDKDGIVLTEKIVEVLKSI
ncbi:hypothetical protein [Pseudobutyrivibrio xylanivorans]|uniref:Ryanodine receptor Ryr domain-containing protein n=1 Tax=Pseudobutyrivibrio xylanivorans TaxID=185007 RepID=A0A5P6VMN2_PSEXY|nr:hypothetical protein [Pseudobutyrivibrio xylanivorans]QFJ53827.1 hypothetical protein FXF36_02565 [Pseudobutyrivibrio xylanivorans]